MIDYTTIKTVDAEIYDVLQKELHRQQNQLELIASENFTSTAVMFAQGSTLTNKYAEGYPGRRYYGGCEYVDIAESLAIERAKKLFNCSYVNVQPHSGSQANQEVFLALLNPGDTILAMSLNSGGHLTHGSPVNLSGKWFHAVAYDVDPETLLIDMDRVKTLALEHKPKLIIAGGSAYPRIIDFKAFREIADSVGAYLMVDMAHFAGLVAGDVFPSPLPYAHIVTTTTHKTLRGPRGGMILSNDADLGKKLNSAVFPGAQGGPLMHVIAGKAIAFLEALKPEFKTYSKQVVENAKTLASTLINDGFVVTTGGTDCHLCLIDLRQKNITGAEACLLLDQIGITCNKNGIPFDPLPPTKTSGIRLGSPACTTRGMKEAEFKEIAHIIRDALNAHQTGALSDAFIQELRDRSQKLCTQFPLYQELG
ncbi:MAG: serine hydroxymethyltransferase [Candidatus Nucleicultricaceae bacterium]